MKTLAKMLTHSLIAAGLAATAVIPALAASAAPGARRTMTVKVVTSDLDLATAKGQRQLDQRVAKAVRTVCRVTDPKTGSRIHSQDASACLAKARADARRQLAAIMTKEQRGG